MRFLGNVLDYLFTTELVLSLSNTQKRAHKIRSQERSLCDCATEEPVHNLAHWRGRVPLCAQNDLKLCLILAELNPSHQISSCVALFIDGDNNELEAHTQVIFLATNCTYILSVHNNGTSSNVLSCTCLDFSSFPEQACQRDVSSMTETR